MPRSKNRHQIEIPNHLWVRMDALADRIGITTNGLAAMMLAEKIDEFEKRYMVGQGGPIQHEPQKRAQ